ncbi:hypothetical protein BDN67DRAFT_894033 [Paxillus ammoniavirescens]|nr:hypothetical protein BDN67DRAFT_894033 [Paxillus ammoniavirescens]
MASTLTLPAPVQRFFAFFPLHTYPPVPVPVRFPLVKPTLWIAPPRNPVHLDPSSSSDLLSADVECLKWQAYIALRGLSDIAVRWDVSPEGGLDGRLPNLHVPASGDSQTQLLPSHGIPAWVDGRVSGPVDALEGYKDEQARDESHAWVSLLEGTVHAALVCSSRVCLIVANHIRFQSLSQPPPSFLSTLFQSDSKRARSIEAILSPPPAPLTGFSSLFPSFGTNVTLSAVQTRYAEAIASLSERLGTDKWFLASENPTALDALIFAYLHCILHSRDTTRIEVTRRVNLVAWERRIRAQVQATFCIALRSP